MAKVIHKHFVCRADCNLIFFAHEWSSLISDLAILIDMEILSGPTVIRCDESNNEGYTGFAIISTSHISIHQWDTGYAQIDIYSCKNFEEETVTDFLRYVGFYNIEYEIIDRTDRKLKFKG